MNPTVTITKVTSLPEYIDAVEFTATEVKMECCSTQERNLTINANYEYLYKLLVRRLGKKLPNFLGDFRYDINGLLY